MTTLKARPTTYRGIRMRSRLEARYAACLDKLGVSWEYEPRAFASENGQYLPDFFAAGSYIEVKGARFTWAEIGDILARMEIIFASDPDADLWLFLDSHGVMFTRKGIDERWEWGAIPKTTREVFGVAES